MEQPSLEGMVDYKHYSSLEVSVHAGLPLPTLTFFVREGALQPSVYCASSRGQHHIFSFTDVLAAMSLNKVRAPNVHAAPFQQLVRFWATAEAKELVKEILRKRPKQPILLLVTEEAVIVTSKPARLMQLMKQHPVVFCIDACALVQELAESPRAATTTRKRTPLERT